VDFSRTEQAAETYKPNANPEEAAIRSQQSNENRSADATSPGAGVPGAASNKPTAASPPAPAASTPGNPTAAVQKESTTNYEVDKTVRIVQKPMGGLQRLAVAVVVNNKRDVAADGKVTSRPLTEDEKNQITSLVKEAMGFNAERGDSLNVLNSAFAETPREVIPEQPFWKQFMTLDYAKMGIQYALSAALVAYLFFGVLRPLLKRVGAAPVAAAASGNANTAPNAPQQQQQEPLRPNGYQENLQTAKQMATQDPKVVANVVKSWVNGNE